MIAGTLAAVVQDAEDALGDVAVGDLDHHEAAPVEHVVSKTDHVLARHVAQRLDELGRVAGQAVAALRGVAARTVARQQRRAGFLNGLAEEGRVEFVQREAPAGAALGVVVGQRRTQAVAGRVLAVHEVAQGRNDDGQGGEALLAVDDLERAGFGIVHHDDRADEMRDRHVEAFAQVRQQFQRLAVIPRVAALEGRDAEIGSGCEDVGKRNGLRLDPDFHCVHPSL